MFLLSKSEVDRGLDDKPFVPRHYGDHHQGRNFFGRDPWQIKRLWREKMATFQSTTMT
jgi:hypothetical protein